MATVKITEVTEIVADVDVGAVWQEYVPRPAVKAARFLGGAEIDGIHIPGGYYAVAFENGIIRAVDPETFELVYAPK